MFVYMEHPELEPVRVADNPDTVKFYEAQGFEKADEPTEVSLPKPSDEPQEQWVHMHHAESGGSASFPNNPEALAGAKDLGWSPDVPLHPSEDPKTVEMAANADAEAEKARAENKKNARS